MRLISHCGLAVLLVIFAFWIIDANSFEASAKNSDLILKVSSDKESYILGELINLQFEITHKKNKIITLRSAPTVEDGYMQVWIAGDDRNFKQLGGAGWGRSEGSKTPQKAASFKSRAEVLWNGKPPPNRPAPPDRLATEYAVMRAGVYFIKATAIAYEEDADSEDDKIVLESELFQIIVNAPVGDDLEVWNKIKENGDLGCFMQNGSFMNAQPDEAQKLLNQVKEIIAKYPDSLLVGQLKQGLEKFREQEAAINEAQRQNRNNNQKPRQFRD